MQTKQQPIGYYLKQLDNLLTEGINAIQAQHGLSRTEWQTLNAISEEQPAAKEKLIELLNPFADSVALESILSKFVEKLLIEIKENMVILSDEGKQLYSSCLTAQQQFRKKVMSGISETEYQVTISTLQKMIENVS